jgi:hypothetical protein
VTVPVADIFQDLDSVTNAPPTKGSTEPTGTTATQTGASQEPFHGLGALLEQADDKKVADAIVQMVRDQAPARRRRRAEAEVAKAWIRGIRGVRIRRQSEDRNDVMLQIPLGAYDIPPLMDRTDELLEKVVSHLLADPPVPDAEPARDDDQARDASEFTTRLLTIEGSESGWNNLSLVRRAERKAGIYGSGFVYPCIDPTGGGWRPMAVRALATAQTVEDATRDPTNGEPLPEDDERLTTRYVLPNEDENQPAALTDDKTQADRQWLPKIRPEVLTAEQVVLLPETCTSVGDAVGCILIRHTPLGKFKGEFADKVSGLSQDQLRELCEWNPEDAKKARPGFVGGKNVNTNVGNGSDNVPDTALVCTLSLYFTSHYAYPKGAYIVIANPAVVPVVHKQTWSGMVELGEEPGVSGETATDEEMLMLPLAQFRQIDDDVDDDPLGRGLVWKLGPPDEVRGEIVAAWLDYLDWSNNPNVMLPMGSNVDGADWDRRDGTPLYYNPAGQPVQEQIPPFPSDGKEFFDRATQAQDSASMLEEVAQGVDSPNINSGVQASYTIQQAHVNMAMLRANFADGQERLWRLTTQLYRVFYTIPQILKFQGDDGAYKAREWSRIDLGSTRDVRIARGSFTQQSPEQKQAMLDQRAAAQLIDREEYERLSASNIRPAIGFQDNPHRMRVRRQISAWRDGPPADFAQQYANYQTQVAQYQATAQQAQMADAQAQQLAASTGQQPPPPTDAGQPPVDTLNPFADVRPVDDEQDVARIRWLDLRREMSSAGFAKRPPEWQQYLVDAYTRARQAAGVSTIAEQQQAAQAQQQQQTQMVQQEQASKAAEAQADREVAQSNEDAKRGDAESQRAFEADQSAEERQHETELTAMQAQGAPIQGAR